ncbi:MAG: outer membrane beta-barrel protein [Alistipes sp.]|nr:outer membrane beta-barrel protein [Alistipes sp.]
MKNLYRVMLSLLMVVAFSVTTWGKQQDSLKGRVVNSQNQPIGYATVVAMANDRQVAGTTTDEKGLFTMTLASGDYRLVVEFVGYKSIDKQIKVSGVTDLGDLVMNEASTEIGEVVVSAQMIRREADRFVVDVANSDSAIGKDGEELLRQSPGVWIQDDKISVNGASGTKLYINDREMKLDGADLLSYIRSLKAEDIAKIEIVPQTGADHDANSSGGAIKITLRRRLENGVMGTVGIYSGLGKYGHDPYPYARINANVGKFTLSGAVSYYRSKHVFLADEQTDYLSTSSRMTSSTDDEMRSNEFATNFSVVYQANPKHSIGIDYSWIDHSGRDYIVSSTRFDTPTDTRLSNSIYDGNSDRTTHYATFNYIFKTDSLGSMFKVLADYHSRDGLDTHSNSTTINAGGGDIDSLYNDRTKTFFRVATASVAREIVFSQEWQLKYGAKYTYNEINSAAQYRYLLGQEWVPSVVSDHDISYTENISAAYAIASFRKGRWSAVMGLRGEYTKALGKGSDVSQEYFSLFPNANLSYALDRQGKHSLVAQYSRSISRPSFWNLTPTRTQISDYTYQTGNALLDPSYNNKISLTGVFAYKYSITLAAAIQTDAIQQMVVADENDPRMLNLTYVNLPKLNNYTASIYLPFAVTKWWDWNINLTGVLAEQQLTLGAPIEFNKYAQVTSNMTFKLPKNFFVDLGYWGMTRVKVSNAIVNPGHNLSVSLKKRVKDSWTFVCEAVNVIAPVQDLDFVQDDFTRNIITDGYGSRFRIRLGATWSFKSGKAFNTKQVEKANDENRM